MFNLHASDEAATANTVEGARDSSDAPSPTAHKKFGRRRSSTVSKPFLGFFNLPASHGLDVDGNATTVDLNRAIAGKSSAAIPAGKRFAPVVEQEINEAIAKQAAKWVPETLPEESEVDVESVAVDNKADKGSEKVDKLE